jgi:hypothetical protein
MKKLSVIFLFFFIFGCKSIGDVLINTLSDENRAKVIKVDVLLLKYKVSGNQELLSSAESIIKDLDGQSKRNKYFEAKVIALYAQLAETKNDMTLISNYIIEIEKRNTGEERLYMLKADLEKDINKKETIIKTGIEKADENNLLKLYLGDVYFLKGKFAESAAMFDDAFINLSPDYKEFYTKRRDIAYNFSSNPPKNVNSIKLLLEDEITVSSLIQLTLNELDVFKKTINYKSESVKDVFEMLKTGDYFYKENPVKLDDKIKRKDIAYFILHIIARLDKNDILLTKYINKSAKTNNPDQTSIELSPVPDIKFSDYFYTAVLVLVEREIMDLPDGTNFAPEKSMNSLDYLGIIKKVSKFY